MQIKVGKTGNRLGLVGYKKSSYGVWVTMVLRSRW